MKHYLLIKRGPRWEVREQSSKRALYFSHWKKEALAKAEAFARVTGGTLNVFKSDGEWEDERKFKEPEGL